MPTKKRKPGTPVCSNCDYDLTGVTDSSKCPECGRPLVEVLTRVGEMGFNVRRYQSKVRLFGLPIVDIALGPAPGERIGKAKGIIAIGDHATGLLAIGGRAGGLVAIGGMAIGGFSFGGLSLGVFSGFGGLATGLIASGGMAAGGLASGGGAFGFAASGGMAVGYYAAGGSGIGQHVLGPGKNSQEAIDFFASTSWFYGGPGFSIWTMLQPMIVTIGAALAAALCVLVLAAFAHWRGSHRVDMGDHLSR